MKRTPIVSSVKRPRPTIGPDRFRKEFGGKGFIHCLVELVKNARDWSANRILIATSPDRLRLQIVDNGRGMDEANRDAFVSVDMTTARGSRQSGQFGTGSKQMLFSHATAVEILTAPGDDSEFAYRFGVDVDHYQAVVLAGGDFDIERFDRRTAWPHEFPTGTQLTYTLRDPMSRAILRGDELAAELSARLPLLFSEIVQVDGKALPEKKIKGKPFRAVQEHMTLGRVVLELYRPERPERRRIEEGLRLTAGEAGEVPIENLFSRLGSDLQARFPTIYLHREVCGTISAEYLKDYANDDRLTFNPRIADDPRTPHFVRLLEQFGPAVQRQLQIKTAEGGGETDDQAVAEVMGLFNRAYNPRGEQPKGADSGVGGGGDEPDNGDEPKHPAIRLGCRQEFEVGEQVEIRAHLRDDLADSFGYDELEWFTERSRGQKACKTTRGITLKAVELGDASVRAALPGTPYSALATYRVVAKRVFTLSATHADIHTGLDMLLTAVNLDKLKGEVVWSVGGVGRLTPEGGRAFYHATTPGTAEVLACDSENPRTLATCQIQVSARPGRLLCIRGEFFRIDDTSYETTERTARTAAPPVRILQGGPVHTLIFDRGAPGYRLALAQGTAPMFIALAVAQAYARFCWLRQQGLNPSEFNFRDLPVVFEEVETAGYEIFEEALKERRTSP